MPYIKVNQYLIVCENVGKEYFVVSDSMNGLWVKKVKRLLEEECSDSNFDVWDRLVKYEVEDGQDLFEFDQVTLDDFEAPKGKYRIIVEGANHYREIVGDFYSKEWADKVYSLLLEGECSEDWCVIFCDEMGHKLRI